MTAIEQRETTESFLHKELREALENIEKVRAKDEIGGIYASEGETFKGAIFGRDSLEVAEDLLEIKPEIARDVFLSLARLQGVTMDKYREEEPGKISHEFRRLYISGQKVDQKIEKIITDNGPWWGGTKEEYLYYGSIDATAFYARLLLSYVGKNGKDFLDTVYKRKDGKEATVKESLINAIQWMERKIASSDLDLIEFYRGNPFGLYNHVWKDSQEGYIHNNGEIANHQLPIAPIEVQAYAYDAFKEASKLFKEEDPVQTKIWEEKAKNLQKNIFKRFWMEDRQYFAQGVDRNGDNRPRKIETLTSNPALLLNTSVFDELPEKEKQLYLKSIIRKIMSGEFLTDAGIRSRSVRHAGLVNFWDYHGSRVTWIKDTYDVAQGLRRQGFSRLADQLEKRIINAKNISGHYYEFFYVDDEGRVHYDPQNLRKPLTVGSEIIEGTNIPEGLQTWTVSAVAGSVHNQQRLKYVPVDNSSWQYTFENEILALVPKVSLLTTPEEIEAAYPQGYHFEIKTRVGEKNGN